MLCSVLLFLLFIVGLFWILLLIFLLFRLNIFLFLYIFYLYLLFSFSLTQIILLIILTLRLTLTLPLRCSFTTLLTFSWCVIRIQTLLLRVRKIIAWLLWLLFFLLSFLLISLNHSSELFMLSNLFLLLFFFIQSSLFSLLL